MIVPHIAVDHEQVVAELVIFVEVAPLHPHLRRGGGSHFLIEHAVAQALRGLDLGLGFRDADLKGARNRQDRPCMVPPCEGSRLENIDQSGSTLFYRRCPRRNTPAELDPTAWKLPSAPPDAELES